MQHRELSLVRLVQIMPGRAFNGGKGGGGSRAASVLLGTQEWMITAGGNVGRPDLFSLLFTDGDAKSVLVGNAAVKIIRCRDIRNTLCEQPVCG